MSTNLNTFLIALYNCEQNIRSGDYWTEGRDILAVAIAYQAYTLAERLDAKLGRIADALETIAKKGAAQ